MNNNDNQKDINYWRGFGELNGNPEFRKAKENEFSDSSDLGDGDDSLINKSGSVTRRKFLALLASSAALAAVSCSDYRDKGAIVPYNKKPEEIIPGIPNFYSSTCTACPEMCGILIKTREGRPVKVDGNPDHPVNKGKICATGQANILNLYDPNRIKEPMFRVSADYFVPVSWNDSDTKIIEQLKKCVNEGKEIAVLTHTISSPSQKKLFEDFTKAFPTTKIYSYELINNSYKKSAFKKCYGRDDLPSIKFDEAKVILAFESDFLGSEGSKVESIRLYSASKDVFNKNDISRFYAVEGNASVTGFNADYRIRLRTDAIEEFILSILNELLIKERISSFSGNSTLTGILKNFDLENFTKKHNLNKESVNLLISDLKNNQGKSVAVAGYQLSESTHIAVNLLNEVVGGVNLYTKETKSDLPLSTKQEIESLISKMNSGNVGAVIHFDTNPVYHFSPDYKYEEALKKAGLAISLTEAVNETSSQCQYTLAINHNFESWGDFKPRTGLNSLQQPVIAPLYNTRQKEGVLLNWIKENKEPYSENLYMNYIKEYWEKNIYSPSQGKNFKEFWYKSLHDGVAITQEKTSDFNFKTEAFTAVGNFGSSGKDFTLLLTAAPYIGDGRFAGNGWLQEIPNPVSKVVWDNYAAISVKDAESLGVKSGDIIDINTGKHSLSIPAFVQPGMAEGTIAVQLGYGRKNAGPIGNDSGYNSIELISKSPSITEWLITDVKVAKGNGKAEIVSTQEHYPIDEDRYNDIHLKREIIQEGTFEEYKKNPKFLKEEKPPVKLFNIVPSYEFNGPVKWAMSIDLNKCTGCNYCVAACNVENNIPVVGKDQVSKNREMMWIRIDRYYSGHSVDPRMSFQPMLCQHCDNAPCENVCPVAATNHSEEGLNQMAYNRCVGTRYCSNNCPYKVRRFNYYNFRDHLSGGYYKQDSLSLMHNPEVTVRSRGVMEKCTFCVQRIMDEKQKATQENREIIGENVKTACQEACPADAIHFGNSNKKDSEINKYREHELGYHVLEEINVRPNVTYIAKLRNVINNNKPEKKHSEHN